MSKPDLCFVEFRVKTRSAVSPDDGHLASYVASLSMLRSGFRNVPLENYAGARLTPASLFVHVKIEDNKHAAAIGGGGGGGGGGGKLPQD